MKTLLTSALLASVIITGTAQADNSLSSLIYEESSNIDYRKRLPQIREGQYEGIKNRITSKKRTIQKTRERTKKRKIKQVPD